MKFYIGSSFKNCEMVNYFSEELEKIGWMHTYNWAKNIVGNETIDDLIMFSNLEKAAIEDSDIVIIIMPAGRGSHVELGIAISENKKIYLCSTNKDEFSMDNMVNFYALPSITRITGSEKEILKKIIEENK